MLKNQLLSRSILKIWDNYEKQVRLSRAKSSTKNIHQLRILTQKMEAALTLAGVLKTNRNWKNILFLIKKVRKSLGPLRDIQVEAKILKSLKVKRLDQKESADFAEFFYRRKAAAKKKAIKCLSKISLKKERSAVSKLVKKIIKIEKQKSPRQIQIEIGREMKSTQLELVHMAAHIDPRRAADIHQFRIHAKKLRYQKEILNSLSNSPKFNLESLKMAQSRAGRIQNNSTLIDTLDQFLADKKHENDSHVLAIRKRISTNQAQFIHKELKKLMGLKLVNSNSKK